MNTAKARLVVAYDAAIAHREANGCHNPDVVCYFSGTAYTKWMQLDRAWKDAWNYYDCWYQNAVDSEYPGHIPHTC